MRPVNIEAQSLETLAVLPEPVETIVETVEAATDDVIEAAPEPDIEAVAAVIPEPVAPITPDDLTRLIGVGPKLAASLAARGVTTFAQIAAWTADDLASVDKDLKLLGRAERDAWVAQATRFAGA